MLETRDFKGQMVLRDFKGQMVLRDFRGLDIRDSRAFRETWELKGCKDFRELLEVEFKGIRDFKGESVFRD